MKALQAGGALPGDAFFRHALASHLWFKVSGCPTLYRVVFWKPLHSFSCFGLQDAQTPPSPRVGEGGRGDERANTPNLPLRPVWENLGADRTGVSHACCFLRLRPAGAHACRPGRCGAPGWRRVGRTARGGGFRMVWAASSPRQRVISVASASANTSTD